MGGNGERNATEAGFVEALMFESKAAKHKSYVSLGKKDEQDPWCDIKTGVKDETLLETIPPHRTRRRIMTSASRDRKSRSTWIDSVSRLPVMSALQVWER